jgi:hypothetical protein
MDIKVNEPEPHGFHCLGIFEIMRLQSADHRSELSSLARMLGS